MFQADENGFERRVKKSDTGLKNSDQIEIEIIVLNLKNWVRRSGLIEREMLRLCWFGSGIWVAMMIL